jgi:hypothetical protein
MRHDGLARVLVLVVGSEAVIDGALFNKCGMCSADLGSIYTCSDPTTRTPAFASSAAAVTREATRFE